ncbi:MAG: S24 family peptidase [Pseudomonadota bacterium]
MTDRLNNLSVTKRVRLMMALRGFRSINASAKALGLNTSTLQSVLSRNSISRRTAERIADQWGFSADWIERGWGPMRQDSEPDGGSDRGAPPPIRQPPALRRIGRCDRKTGWESVGERVRELWRHSGTGSFSEFAHACGLTLERLEEILEIGRIDDDTARTVALAFDVEYEWLRQGMGPFRKGRAEAEVPAGFDAAAPVDSISGRAGQSGPVPDGEFINIRKAGSCAAGEVIFEESPANERYAFRLDWLRSIGAIPGRLVLLEIEGDSMSPVLVEGDTVLIDLNRTLFKEGRLFAVAIGETLFVKRLQIIASPNGPRIRVISVNPEYHSWECGPDDISILGEVVWFGRTLA